MATPDVQAEIWEELRRSPEACLAVDDAGHALGERLPELLAAVPPSHLEAADGRQLLRFGAAASAAQAALRLKEAQAPLRLGLSLCDAAAGSWSEARSQALALAQQAAPGEVLASESACDQLVPGLDAEIDAAPHAPGPPAYSLAPAAAPALGWQQAMPVLMLLPLRVAPGNACDPIYAELLSYGRCRRTRPGASSRARPRRPSATATRRPASCAATAARVMSRPAPSASTAACWCWTCM
jgi:hypothetical protein